ncbi:MAG: hypothetical protein LBG80_11320 [Bacteroidales bacterium]|jgi:hypothetical protein|nr:hypothetical protein [Bacteroidales bacterium]
MIQDHKKTDAEKLIAKINMQNEIIGKQNTVSSIDIDLQLDYIRALYEFYIGLKQTRHIVPKQEQYQNIVPKEQTEKKHNNLSEYGTLSLFDDIEEENAIVDKEKDIAISKSSDENQIQTETKNIPEDKTSAPNLTEISEFDKHEPIVSHQIEDVIEDTQEDVIEDTQEDVIEDTQEDIIEDTQEDIIENAQEDIIEDTQEDVIEDTQENIIEDTQETEKFPEMEFELNLKNNNFPVKDQDNITVTEKEIPDTTVETSIHPQYKNNEEPVPDKPTSIGDKYKSNRPSLNEIVSGFKPDESIGMKLQHENVSDLMKSIDMNNKFLFVKSLFKGNGSLFTEEINKINSISKLHNAISYMEEMKDKYKWDEKSEAYKELFRLVLKKYAK